MGVYVMSKNILNITNGTVFNEYFISNYEGIAVPFCECMMDGETVADIYSEKFIEIRSEELKVDETDYRSKMYMHDVLGKRLYTEIHLWFGKDTFCQMNLLTVLAYLEQIDYRGRVYLNYINDETFDIIEADIAVDLGIYNEIYKSILILKEMPDNMGVLYAKAIDLYFDYHSEDGELMRMIKENADKSDLDLKCLLLINSHEYGLSDLQAEKLIKSILGR